MHVQSRRTAFVALAVTPVLVLGACSSDDDAPETGTEGDGETVTITYYTETGEELFATGEGPIIAAFEEANPGITVEVVNTPFADYNTKLTTELRAGGGPDIGRVNHTDIQIYAGAGFLLPIDEYIASEGIDTSVLIPGLVDIGVFDGNQVTLPLNTDARALYYNPALLEAHGITEPPATWDELVEDVAAFAGTDVYGFGFSSDNDYAMAYETIGPFMKAAGGSLLELQGTSAEAVSASDDATVGAVELLQDIVATGAVPPGQENMSSDTLDQLFAQGKLAFRLGGSWIRPNILEINPDLEYGVDFATAVVPVPEAGMSSGSASGGWQIGLFANSEHPAEAAKLLAFFMQAENLVTQAANEGFPPLQNGLDQSPWSEDPFFDAYNDVLAGSGLPIAPVAQLPEVAATFETTVKPAVLDPSQDAQATLAEFDEAVNTQVLK